METLPSEMLLQVFSNLKARDLVNLRATCRRLRRVSGDNDLWKSICFDTAALDAAFLRPTKSGLEDDEDEFDFTVGTALRGIGSQRRTSTAHLSHLGSGTGDAASADIERMRSLANWDPSYPGEKIDWYHEYVARHSPLSMNWLPTPIVHGQGIQTVPESKGMGLLSTSHDLKVISPLDDGSVCVWDISHHNHGPSSRGSAFARGASGLLSVDGRPFTSPTTRDKATNIGIVESVSVDSFRNKAYIAVQSGLNEVDLATLQVASHTRYPFSIAALSQTGQSTPLTVGTTLTLHLHDHRQDRVNGGSDSDRLDEVATFPASPSRKTEFQRLLHGDIDSRSTHLFQPGPLSILHLDPAGSTSASQGEIFVAGRFPSVLMYDRRTFPNIRATLYSGASLCSMTSLPFAFKPLENDLMRHNQLSVRQAEAAKLVKGDRVVACGEYHGKGSLEIYGLDAGRSDLSSRDAAQAGQTQNASFKNRVNAASSKLLSIANHGTRLIVSDSDGNLRWMERNGSTLVRSWNLNRYSRTGEDPRFGLSFAPAMSDVARKLLPTNASEKSGRIEQDEVLVWTGERIGLMGFTKHPRFGADPDDMFLDEIGAETHAEREQFEQRMRRTLERQADEVQWMRRFGFQEL